MSKQYYLNEIAPRGSMLYNSLLGCEQRHKNFILAIHGLHEKLFELVISSHEPDVFYKKMHYWQNEFENFSSGINITHPILEFLAETLNPWQKKKLFDFFELWKNEIHTLYEQRRIATYEDFFIHSHHNTSLREIFLIQYINDNQDSSTLVAARELGVFFNLATVLLDLKKEIHHNLFRIPRELLEKNKIQEENFVKQSTSPTLLDIYKNIFFTAQEYLEKSRPFYENAMKDKNIQYREIIRARWILSQLYLATLKKLLDCNFDYHKKIKLPFYKQIPLVVHILHQCV